MNTPAGSTAQKTAKPMAAGVINIAAGSLCLLGVIIAGIGLSVCGPFFLYCPFHFTWLFGFLALFPAALGIVSITGGVFALQRRMWGWALAGSITTICLSNIPGIASIILTVLSRDEFDGKNAG
ncbi:MAG: hypothetical protein JXA46_04165 [Dehalococcoidales bacterium]|nr:hypothetical protein [Dehalococcoidales bacterium]